jgi:hypothetical protein
MTHKNISKCHWFNRLTCNTSINLFKRCSFNIFSASHQTTCSDQYGHHNKTQQEQPITTEYANAEMGPHTKRLKLWQWKHSSFHQTMLSPIDHMVKICVMWCIETSVLYRDVACKKVEPVTFTNKWCATGCYNIILTQKYKLFMR